jgi:hypothetical protein
MTTAMTTLWFRTPAPICVAALLAAAFLAVIG